MANNDELKQEKFRMEKLKVFNQLINEREKENIIMQADSIVVKKMDEECCCPSCGAVINFSISTQVEIIKK